MKTIKSVRLVCFWRSNNFKLLKFFNFKCKITDTLSSVYIIIYKLNKSQYKIYLQTARHPVIADILQMAAGFAVRNLLAGLSAGRRWFQQNFQQTCANSSQQGKSDEFGYFDGTS